MDYNGSHQRKIFFEIHSGLARQGPGSRASTLRALEIAGAPARARVLDIGCGPGMQTLDLAAALPLADITALDTHRPFLNDLAARSRRAGYSDRITPICADMNALPFERQSIDLIWCEGAAYIMGFQNALNAWKTPLKPGGLLALSDAVWKTETPAEDAKAFWREYPDMTGIATRLDQIFAAGFEVLGFFELPAEDWLEGYYRPLEARLEALAARLASDPLAAEIIAGYRFEIDTFRRFSDQYSYAFFVTASR